MVYDNLTITLGTICLAAVAINLAAEWQKWKTVRTISKLTASSAFVALAVMNGAAGSSYGRLILAALILSLIGDLCLLSLRSAFLLAGIAAFFFAHIAYAAAFISRPLDALWLVAALSILMVFSLVCLRWLWPHLKGFYRVAVPVYLAAISIMTSLAIAASSASGFALLAVAAITFAASDISVARDRFVKRGIENRVWGLPLYYAAQILFAVSVLTHR